MLHGMYIANPPKGRSVRRKSRKTAKAPAPKRRAKKRLRFSNPPKRAASAPLMANRPAAISSAPSRKRRVAKRRSGVSGYAKKGANFLGIGDIFNGDTLKMAGGVVVGSLGTNILYGSQVLNFLPGRQNVFVASLYKLLIAGVGAKMASKVAPKAATGVMVGGLVVVANDMLTAFAPNLLLRPAATTPATTTPATTSAYLGVNAYVPGVNPLLTGPASAYLAPRANVGRTVESNFVSVAEAYGENPFKS